MSYKALIDSAESLIRAGQIASAAQALKAVQLTRIPDSQRLPLANLFRRTAQPEMGLRILAPRIRSKSELTRKPSVEESSEYAVLLMRVGAVQEAMSVLRRLPQASHPQVSFHLALALITQWDYASAIPNLLFHLEHTTDPYARLVTEMNLAAAHYYTGDPKTASEYASKIRATRDAGRLRANALEILARIAIDERRFNEASELLTEASALLSEAKTFDQLFIEGCRSYLQALKTGSTDEINAYRAEALRRSRFESVREADWFQLRLIPDQALFDRLYIGTPYAGLRRHFRESLGLSPSSSHYTWGSGAKTLDLATLSTAKPQSLIALTAKDFYRPASVGAIFGQLFPDEYFDINSSSLRLRQLAHRARAWLKEEGFDLKLASTGGLYQCEPGPGMRILVPESFPALSRTDRILRELREAFPPDSQFSLREALERLGTEESSLRTALTVGLSQGQLEKYGAGSRTVYLSK